MTTVQNQNVTNSNMSVPQNPIFRLTGSNIVLVFVYSGLVVVLTFIAVKRIVGRVNRSIKFFRKQTEAGSGAPKKLLAEINFQLDRAAQFMYEPKLLQPGQATTDKEENPDYYRMKTVDEISDLDKAFNDLNEELKRPMGKDVCQHLLDVKSHSSGCLKSVRTSHLHSISDLYLHARYGPEPYLINDYKRFKEHSAEIITVLRQRTSSKKSKDKSKANPLPSARASASTDAKRTMKHRTKNDQHKATRYATTSFTSAEQPEPSEPRADTSPLL